MGNVSMMRLLKDILAVPCRIGEIIMGMEIKEDRRVRKTKRALRESLAELLAEKSLQKITVKELTDKADIHRSTFYANYTDIYDLYSQIEDAVIQEIFDIFSENYTVDSMVFFGILFKYISENQQVCRMFLGKNVSPAFYSRLTDLLKEAYLACWRNEYGFSGTDEELGYYVHFYLSGSLAVVGKWVDGNFEYPTEQIMKMFADINNSFGDLMSYYKI